MSEKKFIPEPDMKFEDLPEEKKKYFKEVDVQGGYIDRSAIDNPEEAFEDSFKIKSAKTIGMNWEPGRSDIAHDYAKPWKGGMNPDYQTELSKGGKEVAGDFGTYVVAYAGHFILKLEVEGVEYKIWTERDFKLVLGIDKMTKKVRNKIEAKMPSEIKVEERVGQRGTKYYRITEDDIIKWAKELSSLL